MDERGGIRGLARSNAVSASYERRVRGERASERERERWRMVDAMRVYGRRGKGGEEDEWMGTTSMDSGRER